MEVVECFSLCDRMEDWNVSMKDLEKKKIKRFYLGSYFCSNYFLNLDLNLFERIVTESIYNRCDITLVIPIITEKNFESMKEKLDKLFRFAGDCIDEITVNDYGTMAYLSRQYPLPLNMGRLFTKDYRDPRYKDSYDMICKPKIFTTEFFKIIQCFSIKGIEFDPTNRCIDLSEVYPGLSYAVHTPYCYVTTGQICEYGSISNKLEKKFYPNADCHRECMKVMTTYELQDGQEWYRVGKAVYFKNRTCEVIGIEKVRRIVWCAEL